MIGGSIFSYREGRVGLWDYSVILGVGLVVILVVNSLDFDCYCRCY